MSCGWQNVPLPTRRLTQLFPAQLCLVSVPALVPATCLMLTNVPSNKVPPYIPQSPLVVALYLHDPSVSFFAAICHPKLLGMMCTSLQYASLRSSPFPHLDTGKIAGIAHTQRVLAALNWKSTRANSNANEISISVVVVVYVVTICVCRAVCYTCNSACLWFTELTNLLSSSHTAPIARLLLTPLADQKQVAKIIKSKNQIARTAE